MTYPDIKAAGPDAFRYSSGIDHSTDDIQECHEYNPAESRVVEGMRQAVSNHKMSGWDHSTQTQSHKYTFTQHNVNSETAAETLSLCCDFTIQGVCLETKQQPLKLLYSFVNVNASVNVDL